MTIIVAGKLFIKPGLRDRFLAESRQAIVQAREQESCEDFSVSADPVDPDRVNIFEKWKSRRALDAFRDAGPETEIFALVEQFDVDEFEVDA